MWSRPFAVGRAVFTVLRDNFASVVAGSIAFSAFLSVLPLLALAVAVTTAFGGPELVNRAVEGADPYLTDSAQALFTDALSSASGRVGASLLSLALLLWSALRVFRGLDTAFSLLYDSDQHGFVDGVRDGVVVLVALTAALAVTAVVSALVAFVPGDRLGPLGPLTASATLVGGLALAFLPMYYVFPDVDLSVREVTPGALVAAVGWTALVWGFQLYADIAGQYEVYGAIGAVLLVLLWLYFGSLLLLTGAALNVVLGGRYPVDGDGDVAVGTPGPIYERRR